MFCKSTMFELSPVLTSRVLFRHVPQAKPEPRSRDTGPHSDIGTGQRRTVVQSLNWQVTLNQDDQMQITYVLVRHVHLTRSMTSFLTSRRLCLSFKCDRGKRNQVTTGERSAVISVAQSGATQRIDRASSQLSTFVIASASVENMLLTFARVIRTCNVRT